MLNTFKIAEDINFSSRAQAIAMLDYVGELLSCYEHFIRNAHEYPKDFMDLQHMMVLELKAYRTQIIRFVMTNFIKTCFLCHKSYETEFPANRYICKNCGCGTAVHLLH